MILESALSPIPFFFKDLGIRDLDFTISRSGDFSSMYSVSKKVS